MPTKEIIKAPAIYSCNLKTDLTKSGNTNSDFLIIRFEMVKIKEGVQKSLKHLC